MTSISKHPILVVVLCLSLALAGCAAPSTTEAPADTDTTTPPPAVTPDEPADSTVEPTPTADETVDPAPTGTSPGDAPADASPDPSPTAEPTPEPTEEPATQPPAAPPALGPAAVDLRSAGGFAILSKAGISTTGTTSIVGNLGVSPIDSTAITGFGLVMDDSNVFATSSLVTGSVYAADFAPPMPTQMTTAIGDMALAYDDAAGRTDPTATELGAGSIGGMTIAPGLYKWSTGVSLDSDLTLEGGPDDVWIFQIAQTLDVASGVKVTLVGGAQAKNVFWQVADQATFETTSVFQGNVLSYSAIVLKTGATLEGRALAQTAVTLDASSVTKPA